MVRFKPYFLRLERLRGVSERTFLFALILLAAASVAFWGQKSWGIEEVTSDAAFYDAVAVNFMEGRGMVDTDGEDPGLLPGYPLFLSGIYGIFGHDLDMVRVMQGMLFILTVLITYELGKKMLGLLSARYVALFLSVFYPLPVASSILQREVLIAFALMATVYALYELARTREMAWTYASAFLLGLLIWVTDVSKFLFILVFPAFVFALYKQVNLRRLVAHLAVFAGIFGVIFGSTILYSLVRHDSLALTERGMVLYSRAEIMHLLYPDYPAHFMGHSLGYYFAQKIFPQVDPRLFRSDERYSARLEELQAEGYSKYERDQMLFQEGLSDIKANPHQFVLMSILDFVSFNSPLLPHGNEWKLNYLHFTFAENRHQEIPEFLKAGYLLFWRLLWFAALGFALYYAVRELRHRPRAILFLLVIIVYFNAVYSLTHAIPRYAIPLYPLYLLLAGGGLSLLIRHRILLLSSLRREGSYKSVDEI